MKKQSLFLLITMLAMSGASSTAFAGRNGMRWDKTPDNFSFVDQTGIALNTTVNANNITITGINTSINISISGGEYSINGSSYTTSNGNVNNGDVVRVRQTSSSQYQTQTSAVLNVNGVTDSFDVTTLAGTSNDSTPDAFSFNDQTGVALSTQVVSNSVTINGINTNASVSISGGEYSINGGAYTSSAGSVNNGNTITVRQTSSSAYATTTNATLTVGGVSDVFSVTTLAAPVGDDTTPDAFSFTDQNNVALSSVITSNAISITGINVATAISVSGGEYSVNGGAYTATSSTVNNNDTVTVRQTSSDAYFTTTDAVLTVGSVSDTFSVTTEAAPIEGFILDPQSTGNAAFTSEHFAGSENCTMCHNGLTDNQGNDVSIEKDWSATMMANSARDPFWKAKVRSEINRNPHLEDVINDKCTRCHAPMANYEIKTNDGGNHQVFDGGILSNNHSRHDEAMSGVSCTLCHQITPPSKPITLSEITGKYSISQNKTIYGPYTDLFPNPMIMNTGYTPTFSQHTKESEMCATCHNLKTPYVDDAGNVLSTTPESEFPEQMPYTEWLHSDYASAQNTQSCQSCHMSRANGVPISNRPMWLAGRDNFAVHEFVGANKLMLGILNDNKEQLGVTATNFADILAATDAMLDSAANLEVLNPGLSGGQLSFDVKVNSNTGHKLPSAYPSRRVIVHVAVFDEANNVVFESGKPNADGSIQGVDADSDETAYEPHYELITDPEQVQVYEAIMGDNNNNVTYTLLRGMTYLKDNRLLPNGFDKATAPDDVAVTGAALTDANFIGGSDEVSYQISGLASGSYRVKVELVYQTLAYGFARDLFKDNSDETHDFKQMFNAASNKAIVLKTQEIVVQ